MKKWIQRLMKNLSSSASYIKYKLYSFFVASFSFRFDILLVLLLAICAFLLWSVFSSLLPYISGKAFGYTQISENTIARDVPGKIRLFLYFSKFDNENTRVKQIGGDLGLVVELHEVSLAPSYTYALNKDFCIESIELEPVTHRTQAPFDSTPFSGGIRRSSSSRPQYSFDSFCVGQEYTWIDRWSNDSRIINGEIENVLPVNAISTFYYPFDKLTFETNIIINAKDVRGGNPLEIDPDIIEVDGYITSAEWDETIMLENSHSTMYQGDNQYIERPVKKIVIEYRRPLFNRVITVVILVSLIVFSLSLAFIKDLSSFLEAGIGILLGLWGVQDMLIPSSVNGPFLVSVIIMLIYLLLVFVVAYRFVFKPLWTSFLEKSIIKKSLNQ